ncbi:MAG: hypothetical protein K9M57_01040, partial [Phycisphaerae bacterium]|nr:hypothetical protein [Phycisphaerae bacterium]
QGICSLEDAVYSNFSSGLDILTSSGRNGYVPVHLLSGPHIAERLEVISRPYDHVIIDTTPVLIAPDALLWANMADAVVLSSFAGMSAGPALKEAMSRLAQINVKVLGNILSSVRPGSGYGYYGYNAAYKYGTDKKKKRRNTNLFLQAENPSETDTKNS